MSWLQRFCCSIVLACAVLGAEALAECGTPESVQRRIFIIGDSTAAQYDPDGQIVGWGQMMQARFGRNLVIRNMAIPGRSARSFVTRGDWGKVRSSLKPGDHVFIQFGHNDASGDPERATRPFADYSDFLRRYIAETRNKGATPVLLTPVSIRLFDGGTLRRSHGEYPLAMKAVAEQTKTPVIDVTTMSESLLSRIGEAASYPLFMISVDGEDNVHLTRAGASRIAELITDALRTSRHSLAECLVDPASPTAR